MPILSAVKTVAKVTPRLTCSSVRPNNLAPSRSVT